MAKKTFKDNPALQFLSAPQEAESAAQPAPVPDMAEKPPEGYKLNPMFVETKSRRMQLVLKPSLYEKVKVQAAAAGLSVNEYVHGVLETATKK